MLRSSFRSLHSSSRILEQKRNCSQSSVCSGTTKSEQGSSTVRILVSLEMFKPEVGGGGGEEGEKLPGQSHLVTWDDQDCGGGGGGGEAPRVVSLGMFKPGVGGGELRWELPYKKHVDE